MKQCMKQCISLLQPLPPLDMRSLETGVGTGLLVFRELHLKREVSESTVCTLQIVLFHQQL